MSAVTLESEYQEFAADPGTADQRAIFFAGAVAAVSVLFAKDVPGTLHDRYQAMITELADFAGVQWPLVRHA